jgi:hypothetical protein
MKKWLILLLVLLAGACIRQTVHNTSTFIDGHSYQEVWAASIRSVHDIAFTVDSVDKDAGFISAESGTHIGQEVGPRLSILISQSQGRVFVECRMLQKEQFIDLFGHGKRTVNRFMQALNSNLNHPHGRSPSP